MSEKSQILFMQTRLIRLASEEWHMSVERVVELFRKVDVFDYTIYWFTLRLGTEFFIVKVMKRCLMILQNCLRERG